MMTNEVKTLLFFNNSAEVAEKVENGEFTILDKPARSKVWTLFARILNGEGVELPDYVYCKSCGKVFKFHKGSTSNLVKHRCYIATFTNADNDFSISELEKPTTEFSANTHNNLAKLLTRWVIKDCRPYDLIKNEELRAVFREIAMLGSKFGSDIDVERLLPSVPAIAKNVSEIYEQCFERVKMDIEPTKANGFGLTCEVCTNNFTKRSYLGLTIHYLQNGSLTFRLLGFRILEAEKVTDQNVTAKVREILQDFDYKLSSKSIIVTNKDLNITTDFLNDQNMPCITQLINNALQESVELVPEVKEIISACFKLVNFLKKMELNSQLGRLLTTHYPGRWETICKLMSSVEGSWCEINKHLQNINESTPVWPIDIYNLSAVTKILLPFGEAIETLEDDSFATLHLVMVYLHELRKSCSINDDDFEFIKSLKGNIRLNLEKIVSENITTLHKIALFLYPPTNKLLQFSNDEKICIEKECIRLMKCFRNESTIIVKQEQESAPHVPKHRKLFSDFVESETNRDPNELIIQEIQCYRNIRVVNNADFDVLNWWEFQKENFPLLFKLSSAVFTTPSSTSALKRIFSKASNLLCETSRESDIEKIMFINSNSEHDEIDSMFST